MKNLLIVVCLVLFVGCSATIPIYKIEKSVDNYLKTKTVSGINNYIYYWDPMVGLLKGPKEPINYLWRVNLTPIKNISDSSINYNLHLILLSIEWFFIDENNGIYFDIDGEIINPNILIYKSDIVGRTLAELAAMSVDLDFLYKIANAKDLKIKIYTEKRSNIELVLDKEFQSNIKLFLHEEKNFH